MTTNQTIDGVPRAWLEEYEGLADLTSGDAQKLRALLDTPACKTCGDSGWVPEPFSIRENVLECPECKPAAQPQGEPVAYRYMDRNTGTCGPTKCGGIYYAEIPEYGRSWQVTTKSHGAVLIERKQHAIANGFVDSHPSLTVIIEPLYAKPPAPVAWTYCPECGCEEIHHQQGRHKQCAECHQEWFSDLDYSDVVRGHLKKLKTEQPAPVAVATPVDPERERLMEIVQQYPNVDPLKYDAAVRTLRK